MSADPVIGVDLGGTKALAGAVSAEGEVAARARREVRGRPAPEVLDAVAAAVAEAAGGARVARVGIGIPGVLSGRLVRRCVHLPIEGLDVGAELSARLDGVPVTVDNDANGAAVAEARLGAGRGAASMVLLTIGTGIGGALVLDGELVRGGGGAGEFGHTTIDLDGPRCTCGNRGCLEALVSGPALVVAALEAGLDEDEGLSGRRVTALAHQGHPAAVEAATRVGRALGAGIAALVNGLDPDVVVVGGGVIGLGDLLLDPAREEARARALVPERVRVVAAACGEEAGMIGAGLLAHAAAGRPGDRASVPPAPTSPAAGRPGDPSRP